MLLLEKDLREEISYLLTRMLAEVCMFIVGYVHSVDCEYKHNAPRRLLVNNDLSTGSQNQTHVEVHVSGNTHCNTCMKTRLLCWTSVGLACGYPGLLYESD
jgi:hypothetical protein